MLRKSSFSIAATSLYLLAYIIVLHTSGSLPFMLLMLAFSPVLMVWMVYLILKYGVYSSRELEDGEEWGYEDRKKEDLGIFF